MCDHPSKAPNRPGGALEHGRAHARDHQRWSRRQFTRTLGLAGSIGLLLGRLPVKAMSASPLAWALSSSDSDRILVLIRLKGGNDGLNTIVPLADYGAYRALRPGLAIPERDIIALGDGALGLAPALQPLQRLWQDGRMKVVNNVGYPDQNLSHFRSSDIWASASDAGEELDSGWLGRWLDGRFPNYLDDPPPAPPAVQIGGAGNLTFANEAGFDMGVVVDNPAQLAEIAELGALYDPGDVPPCYYGEQLSYLRTVANSTFRYAEVISRAYDAGSNAVEYRRSLGEQLALVARLIRGGLGTALYMVTLDGFDTHARQRDLHPALLDELAVAVRDFYADLDAGGHGHRVLCMTQSEFGRRPDQNASGGTDHGAAAPLVVFGEGVQGNGFVGPGPDLRDLDANGNLRYGVDFRQLYATVLEGWLCVDGAVVDEALEQPFERLPALGLACTTTSTPRMAAPALRHWAYAREGQLLIHYVLPQHSRVRIQLFNILGQPIGSQGPAEQLSGEQIARFHLPFGGARGQYVYRIEAGRARAAGKIVLN